MKKILVIGSLNTDFSFSVKNIPKPGETLNATSLKVSNGGKGANQAYTIGKLGGNVSMLGMVGNDSYAKNLINSLKSVNVNVNSIKKSKLEKTGMAFINVSENGENSITTIHGANYEITPDVILKNKSLIYKADIILMQLEIPLESVKKVLEIANDKVIILDPAPANKDILNFNLSNVYLMKPNITELSGLTDKKIDDEASIIEAASILIKKGVKNIVVSLGEKGCYLVNNNTSKFFPSIKSNTVDTTAAGDSFIASIALSLSDGKSIEEGIKFATKVASLVVTKKGAQDSIPTLKEVLK